ncbi:ATP-binding cassette domain-containing protein [uncultured Adlercreutzia sp.]|uniref:ATP-binding cassette domain-containing protein n=1 Tax=uncultured Adlercreutzia sp. TaxID=875803 RepID=UPI0026F3C2AC|nr:ATP-binding cassette domain-containing protein [uncultured Adlercreutzia sp.]
MAVIEARGLAKAYGGRRVVSDFTMTVSSGDIYGFVGNNGAGKSTVMKMICGDVTPTAGEVVLFEGAPEGARRIGVLIEQPGLLPGLTAYENVMAKALALGLPDGAARSCEVLRLVGLDSTGRKKVLGFSLGMKQRLGLALALLGNPDVLLLDEPFNGLDPEATRALRNLIVRLNETMGITVVVSSHVLDQLDRFATRYGVIADGRMVRQMTAEEVAAECATSLRVRTTEAARDLALLEEAFPEVHFTAHPDGSLVISGAYEPEAIARYLRDAGAVVLEFSQDARDIEDYFVALMEGGRYV